MNRNSWLLGVLTLTAILIMAISVLPMAPRAAADGGQPTFTMTMSASTITPGSRFSYLVDVIAPDDIDADNVKATVWLPSGVSVVTASGPCGVRGKRVSCSFEDMEAGESGSASIRAMAGAGMAAGTAVATGQLTCDICAGPIQANVARPVTPRANLSMAVDGPNKILAGRTSTYLLRVRNLGPSNAAGVRITDRLPKPLRFASGSGCRGSGRTVSCKASVLGAGQLMTRQVNVKAPDDVGARHEIKNKATVRSRTPDPNPATRTDSAWSMLRNNARVVATSHASHTSIVPGENFTYSTTLRSRGPSPAKNLRLRGKVPAGMQALSATSPATGCTTNQRAFSCRLGTVAAGESVSVVLNVRPDPAMGAKSKAVQRSRVSCTDCTKANGIVISNHVRPQANIAVSGSVKPGHIKQGDTATYAVTLKNAGPSTATDASVVASLPTELTFESAPGCSASGASVTCALAALPPGQSRTWDITTKANGKIAKQTQMTSQLRARMASSITDPVPSTEKAVVTNVADPPTNWWPWVIGGAIVAVLLAAIGGAFWWRRRARGLESRSGLDDGPAAPGEAAVPDDETLVTGDAYTRGMADAADGAAREGEDASPTKPFPGA